MESRTDRRGRRGWDGRQDPVLTGAPVGAARTGGPLWGWAGHHTSHSLSSPCSYTGYSCFLEPVGARTHTWYEHKYESVMTSNFRHASTRSTSDSQGIKTIRDPLECVFTNNYTESSQRAVTVKHGDLHVLKLFSSDLSDQSNVSIFLTCFYLTK